MEVTKRYNMKNIIIIGAGGHASVIIDIIECMKNNGHQVNIKGLLDDIKNASRKRGIFLCTWH